MKSAQNCNLIKVQIIKSQFILTFLGENFQIIKFLLFVNFYLLVIA